FDHAQTSDLRTEAYRRHLLDFLRREIGEG
ncbi:MAG: hypothetical protein QOH86_960, partial [Sphingomonadales bacterium]|nr:hypothetical protein [Sphingomonadales bacterium]